ncbi:MAG TPA: sulfotransferase [Rhodothermales bacterium]|nr:sulfotransferase [Rhodothermales bacterium]
MNNRTFLLVLGAPRSGTTLLTAMIGRHDEVAMLNEDLNGTMRKVIGKRVVGNKLCVPNQIELRERGGPWQRKLQRRGYFQYRPASSQSIEDYMARRPLKLVAIVRDADSVVTSIMGRGKKSFRLAVYRWRRSIEVIHELNECYSGQLFLLTFEQLVSDPQPAMRGIAEHLGITYQPKMLEGYAYTPIYKNSGIDSARARKQTTVDIRGVLGRDCAGVFEKYETLIQACTGNTRTFVQSSETSLLSGAGV